MIQVIIIINRNSQNRVSKNSISKGFHNTPDHNIVKFFDALANFSFTTNEKKRDCQE